MNDLIQAKRDKLQTRMQRTGIEALRAMASMQRRALPFLTTIGEGTAIVGQVRYQMPHTDDLSSIYDPVSLAKRYVEAGVNAVALFTDTVVAYDGVQDMALMADALRFSKMPLIYQNFILHEYHVVEARAAGASVVVLTSGIVPPDQLRQLTSAVHRNLMTAVVNVFNEEQLEAALSWSPRVIGLSGQHPTGDGVDLDVVRRLRQHIPPGQNVMISRPLASLQEVQAAASLNVNAITVGKSLILDTSGIGKLKALLNPA